MINNLKSQNEMAGDVRHPPWRVQSCGKQERIRGALRSPFVLFSFVAKESGGGRKWWKWMRRNVGGRVCGRREELWSFWWTVCVALIRLQTNIIN